MRKLFIDANIYLGFYNTNAPEFKRLLKSLVEVAEKIIVTQQIVDEVCRNKLNVFKDSISNYIEQSTVHSLRLPEHLDNAEDKKLNAWNKKREKELANIKESNEELKTILKNIFEAIGKSTDTVSNELLTIFRQPLNASKEAFQKAVQRKQIGNPPGKPNDPLGDQLSWEILLEHLEGVTELYIVTNDTDYTSSYNDLTLLNPVLYNDLIKLKPDLIVHVFRKLSLALKAFNQQEPIKALPAEKELSKIVIEEPELQLNPYGARIEFAFNPETCPYCHTKGSLIDIGYQRSLFGGVTQQYHCQNCKRTIDSGINFE